MGYCDLLFIPSSIKMLSDIAVDKDNIRIERVIDRLTEPPTADESEFIRTDCILNWSSEIWFQSRIPRDHINSSFFCKEHYPINFNIGSEKKLYLQILQMLYFERCTIHQLDPFR